MTAKIVIYSGLFKKLGYFEKTFNHYQGPFAFQTNNHMSSYKAPRGGGLR